jgi:hypothetical protein
MIAEASLSPDKVLQDGYRYRQYVNQSLLPRQVFVPSVLEDDLDSFTYSLQSFDEQQWPGVEAQLFLT